MTPEQERQSLYDLNPFLFGYSSNNISNIPDLAPRQTGQKIDTGRGSYYHVDADGDIDRSQEHFVSAKDIPFDQLVEKSFSLVDINDAVEFALSHKPIRVMIKP